VAEEIQDDIIVIDEANASGIETQEVEESSPKMSDAKKKKILLFGLGGLILTLLIVIVILLFIKLTHKPEKIDLSIEEIQTALSKEIKKEIKTSQLEKMITKANYLYANGSQDEALKLYKKIAIYSEAISQYNLGVAQLREGEYDTALANFKNAIAKGEHRCVSAINIAVCSLHQKNEEQFNYYIDLAYAYLPYESNSPLYSYYYSLVNFYKGNYLESLSSLSHPSSKEYRIQSNKLKSKINTLYGNYHQALSALESSNSTQDAATLGMLYANIGDLTLAKEYLRKAITENPKGFKEQLALSYVYLKSGLHADGGTLLRTITDMYGEDVYHVYPINLFLRQSLFEPQSAQKYLRNKVLKSRNTNYHKLFYFAPYKVFNASKTISYIRKGTANMFIDDISSAKEYLEKSTQTSTVNYGIAKAIQKALSFHLNEANSQLQSLHVNHPRHSILNYNLALTYAQMGNFVSAHKYFLKSYYLDADNYLSGIFAIMCSQIINQPNPKLRAIIKENLMEEDDSEAYLFYRALLNFSQDNFVATLPWLETHFKNRPIYLALNILIANKVGRQERAIADAKKLVNLQHNDILPHLIYSDLIYNDLNNKAYAKALHSYLSKRKFDFNDLYSGPFITRYLYASTALITGTLYPLREQLRKELATTTKNPQSIMQALALISIYSQNFESAYLLYNQLIDEYKIRDSLTLFLGAVASIGAKHLANSIALLQLAKLKDPNNLESRYALGLLYLESKNNQGAGIQFQHIGNSGFVSQYFNFSIDTEKLLFQRRQEEKK
jgi:Flp pilus assembly protein TadD